MVGAERKLIKAVELVGWKKFFLRQFYFYFLIRKKTAVENKRGVEDIEKMQKSKEVRSEEISDDGTKIEFPILGEVWGCTKALRK